MRVHPARLIVGVLILVAGLGGFVYFLVSSLSQFFGALERVEVPGVRDVSLRPGHHSIYWETRSRFTTAPSLNELDLSVTGPAGGRLPVAGSLLGGSRYSTTDRVAVFLGAFTVANADVYTIRVGPHPGKTLPAGNLSLSRSLGFPGVLRIVGGSLLLLGGGIGIGLPVILRKPRSR